MKALIIAINFFLAAFFTEAAIKIQSVESRTVDDQAVYNEIAWFKFANKDVWMMNQSHHGLETKADEKDRIVIIIDKTKVPKSAYFMQVKPGPLVWSEELYAQRIAFKVSCYTCHSNGLRSIRAALSGSVKLSALQQAELNFYNYRIRSYGLIAESLQHLNEDKNLKMPFRFRSQFDNQILRSKTCFACHDGKKQSVLSRQNAGTIQFMVENHLMPPSSFKLDKKERSDIENFIVGL